MRLIWACILLMPLAAYCGKWKGGSREGEGEGEGKVCRPCGFLGLKQCCRRVNGNWGSWAAYGPCDKTCGGGRQISTRLCRRPRRHRGVRCIGQSTRTSQCNTNSCPVPPFRPNRDDCWRKCGRRGGKCSRCGSTGYCCRRGRRDCSNALQRVALPSHHTCVFIPDREPDLSKPGKLVPSRSNSDNCWRKCGTRGGKCTWCGSSGFCCRKGWNDCSQKLQRLALSNHHTCIRYSKRRVNGNWGSWTESGPCDKTCGGGRQQFNRLCDNPPPQHGGKGCVGERRKTSQCNRNACPVNGNWGSWTESGPCDKTCGGGRQMSTRLCNNPPPKHGGKRCIGERKKSSQCNMNACPDEHVLGVMTWGKWGETIMCKDNLPATGFRLRVEDPIGSADDTALNGIQLLCKGGSVTSQIVGYWGVWKPWQICDNNDTDYIRAFDVRTEPDQRLLSKDNTAANNVRMKCNSGTVLDGNGTAWGTWEGYKSCRKGSYLCGVQARIEGKKGEDDDTALNQLKFKCCARKVCSQATCKIACLNGFERDDNGCEICKCKGTPTGPPFRPNPIGCWIKCGRRGGKCNRCGSTGYCCRRGKNTCPKALQREAIFRHYTCVFIPDRELDTAKPHGVVPSRTDSKKCWKKCGRRGGKCTWCGSSGFCCRKGWNDCSQKLQRLALKSRHTCIRYNKKTVNGNWGSWMDIGTCDKTCGGGRQRSNRLCDNPRPQHGGKACVGESIRTSQCNMNACTVNGNWGSWTESGPCDKTCGGGSQTFNRSCNNPPPTHCGKGCVGESTKMSLCNMNPCSVNGNWGSWTEYGSCDKTCGGGSQKYNRSCNDPPPQNGGKECVGASTKTSQCNVNPCSVDGNWGSWTESGSCDKTCGGGSQKSIRSCNDPPPQHGGKNCVGESTKTSQCNINPCPVNGNWGSWTESASCDKTCGGGSQKSIRSCNDPPPQNGGKECVGESTKTSQCNINPCPVNGNWGSWTESGPCDKTCGGGSQKFSRSCDDPTPQHGGKGCVGESTKTSQCNTNPCPVNGNWGSWTESGPCDKTCGGGRQKFNRLCDDPAPQNGGKVCVGESTKTSQCNMKQCPDVSCDLHDAVFKEPVYAHGCTEKVYGKTFGTEFKPLNIDESDLMASARKAICDCAKKATAQGYKTFAILEFWEQCWGSNMTIAEVPVGDSKECVNYSMDFKCKENETVCSGSSEEDPPYSGIFVVQSSYIYSV